MFPGFGDNGIRPIPEKEFDIALKKVLPNFAKKLHNTNDCDDDYLEKCIDSDGKTIYDIRLVIIAFIFGCYNCQKEFRLLRKNDISFT